MIDATKPPDGFDESSYLIANPDVADAVTKGIVTNAWVHAILYGYREGRAGISEDNRRQIDEYWIEREGANPDRVPPAALRARVHGAADFPGFFLVGTTVASNLDQALEQSKIFIGEAATVLDFGSGCGRVLQHVASRHPGWQLYGTDIDPEAVDWCKGHIGDLANLSVNNVWPPSPFPDNLFDLVYSISVFTHLPEDMQYSWLKELQRITKPGATLFLTILNMSLAPDHLQKADGFLYDVGHGTEGLPEFYQLTYHTSEYIYDIWAKYFLIIRFTHPAMMTR